MAAIEPFRATVEFSGGAEQKGQFWADFACVLNSDLRLRDTAFALAQAITNAQALGDLAKQATLTSNPATVQGNLDHVPQALALAQAALTLQERLGTTAGPTGGVVMTYPGLYTGMSGQFEKALAHLDEALLRFRRDGQTVWIAVANNHKT